MGEKVVARKSIMVSKFQVKRITIRFKAAKRVASRPGRR